MGVVCYRHGQTEAHHVRKRFRMGKEARNDTREKGRRGEITENLLYHGKEVGLPPRNPRCSDLADRQITWAAFMV